MQGSYQFENMTQPGITLTVELFTGGYRISGSSAEVSISCASKIVPGVCVGLCVKAASGGRMISVSAAADTVYGVVREVAEKFTTVVYSVLRRICRKAGNFRKYFRAVRLHPSRCRMAQLSFAGGLRL